ncbi:ATP-binding cassette sub-family D member 3 isoform X3 [Camelus bactrianus]|uniref:ATP-binding cassette sub-family D member 3 isoform X3 n=1 Tax=Camelus bactrianus TaxID=9837 RepID=A0AC58QUZ3_CAMBA
MQKHGVLGCKKNGKPPLQNNEKEGKKERAVVDKVFFLRLTQILKIMIPKTFCKETGYLILIAVMLVSRTYCDVLMIQNGTLIESGIIGRNRKDFKRYLFNFIAAMPLISLVNNFLKFGLNELKLCFRIRLTKYLYEEYLQAFTYYKMGNLDNRIANPDQLLTQDVEKFCNSVVDLYSNLSKPFLDIVLYIFKLTTAIGAQGPASMMAYLIVSGLFLTRLRRPIGKMTVTEQKFEGEYRYVNSRLITNSEEIAFYNGNKREKQTIHSVFRKLVEHLHNFILFRFSMGFIDNIIAKYLATVVGYLVVSRPFLDLSHPRHLRSSHSELLEDYYQSGRMLLRMSQALGRIVLAGREMTRLAGFTARITELMQVLKDLNHGKYERTMVSQQEKGEQDIPLIPGAGEIINADNIIKFDHVPLATPNGDILIRDLNFEVRSGANVLICGPNGCGKSSLFRVLGELWPLFGGRLTKPERGKLFYVPQRPYMTLGTLRDQVIYPDGREDQKKKGISDLVLKEYLDNVQLGHILEREGGWDSVQDWMDVLSGGEKQRMALTAQWERDGQAMGEPPCDVVVGGGGVQSAPWERGGGALGARLQRLLLLVALPWAVLTAVLPGFGRWQDYFIISPSLPSWMNAQVQSVWMWKATSTVTVERLASPSSLCRTESPFGNTMSTTCTWTAEAITNSNR